MRKLFVSLKLRRMELSPDGSPQNKTNDPRDSRLEELVGLSSGFSAKVVVSNLASGTAVEAARTFAP